MYLWIVREKVKPIKFEGIISKAAPSDWVSLLDVIPKPDGNVRLYVDCKMGVNERPVNTNSKCFCCLDLFKAYLHIPVDEETGEIHILSTHRITYRMNILSFGINTVPSEFNRIIDQVFQGLPKPVFHFDDVISLTQ